MVLITGKHIENSSCCSAAVDYNQAAPVFCRTRCDRLIICFSEILIAAFLKEPESGGIRNQIVDSAIRYKSLKLLFEIGHCSRKQQHLAVQDSRDFAQSKQTWAKLLHRQHVNLIQHNDRIGKIVQLSQPAAFVVVQRFKKLHLCRDHYRNIPVFSSAFQLLCGIRFGNVVVTVIGMMLQYGELVFENRFKFIGGLLKIGTYAGGPPNLFTLPLFINPQTGDTTDLKNAVICILISMAITFVLTFLFYKDEKADEIDAQG